MNPIVERFTIGGITAHDQFCDNISIHGGVLACDPSPVTGNCIVNLPGVNFEVTGCHLIAGRAGLNATGPMNASNCYIEPVIGPTGGQGVYVTSSDVNISNITINDENSEFTEGINIDTANGVSIENIKVDATIHKDDPNCILVNTTGASGFTITNLELTGQINTTGDSQAVHFLAEDGMISNVDYSMDIIGPVVDQGIRIGGAGGVDSMFFHDCRIEAGLAAIYDRDSIGSSGNIHIHDCDFESGGITLSFNGTNGNTVSWDEMYVSDCELPGTIDHSGITDFYLNGELIVAEGTVTLSSGTGSISTGVEIPVDVYLDPSNRGANGVNIDVSYTVLYDSAVPENTVVINEETTAVGNPTIAYTIIGNVEHE